MSWITLSHVTEEPEENFDEGIVILVTSAFRKKKIETGLNNLRHIVGGMNLIASPPGTT